MPTELELKDAAWHYANNVNIAPSTANAQNYFTGVHNAFLAGSEWQSKKDEEIINGFFSRETVEGILEAFSDAVYQENNKDKTILQPPVPEWFNTNYPPKTNQ